MFHVCRYSAKSRARAKEKKKTLTSRFHWNDKLWLAEFLPLTFNLDPRTLHSLISQIKGIAYQLDLFLALITVNGHHIETGRLIHKRMSF
jgi:hypothetical protein